MCVVVVVVLLWLLLGGAPVLLFSFSSWFLFWPLSKQNTNNGNNPKQTRNKQQATTETGTRNNCQARKQQQQKLSTNSRVEPVRATLVMQRASHLATATQQTQLAETARANWRRGKHRKQEQEQEQEQKTRTTEQRALERKKERKVGFVWFGRVGSLTQAVSLSGCQPSPRGGMERGIEYTP